MCFLLGNRLRTRAFPRLRKDPNFGCAGENRNDEKKTPDAILCWQRRRDHWHRVSRCCASCMLQQIVPGSRKAAHHQQHRTCSSVGTAARKHGWRLTGWLWLAARHRGRNCATMPRLDCSARESFLDDTLGPDTEDTRASHPLGIEDTIDASTATKGAWCPVVAFSIGKSSSAPSSGVRVSDRRQGRHVRPRLWKETTRPRYPRPVPGQRAPRTLLGPAIFGRTSSCWGPRMLRRFWIFPLKLLAPTPACMTRLQRLQNCAATRPAQPGRRGDALPAG
jgi:hypothetical protein